MPGTSTVQALGWEWPELGPRGREPYQGPARARYTYRGDDFALGAFSSARRDPLWTQVSWIGEGHHIVFPTTGVGICVMSEDPFLTGPNHVVLCNPGDQYKEALGRERRGLVDLHDRQARTSSRACRAVTVPRGRGPALCEPHGSLDATRSSRTLGSGSLPRTGARSGPPSGRGGVLFHPRQGSRGCWGSAWHHEPTSSR